MSDAESKVILAAKWTRKLQPYLWSVIVLLVIGACVWPYFRLRDYCSVEQTKNQIQQILDRPISSRDQGEQQGYDSPVDGFDRLLLSQGAQRPPAEIQRSKKADSASDEPREWVAKFFCDTSSADYLLAVFTFLLFVSTVGLWWVTWRALRHTESDSKRQARDMEESLRISGRAADAALASLARPWLFVTTPLHNRRAWLAGKERLTVAFSIRNYGNAPAIIGAVRGAVFISPSKGKVADIPIDVSGSGIIDIPEPHELRKFIYGKNRNPNSHAGVLSIQNPIEPQWLDVERKTVGFVAPIFLTEGQETDRYSFSSAAPIAPKEGFIPLESSMDIFFIGIVIYGGPDERQESLNFCFRARPSEPFKPVFGAPYNERRKIQT